LADVSNVLDLLLTLGQCISVARLVYFLGGNWRAYVFSTA